MSINISSSVDSMLRLALITLFFLLQRYDVFSIICYLCDEIVDKVKKKAAPHKPQSIDEILKEYWGYDSFRPMQRDIIESVMAGRDTLALLPTGGGKSLTYQVPALAMEGLTIVITPLIALMKDQVDRLKQLNIPAVAIHSGLSTRQIDLVFDNCMYGSTKLLYIAPERLASAAFLLRASRLNVSLIAVDEAHCISQWGYDFRPSYQQIGILRSYFTDTPVLALTASATKTVCDDIMSSLNFSEPNLLTGDFARPNLVYVRRQTSSKSEMVLKMLSSVQGAAIVYTRTRKGCENLTEFLHSMGVSATFYHGGLPFAERSIRQNEWLTGEVRVIVATNAFGMGIDKPDVRLVIHYMMSDCLESYYQEAGRAGRDGVRSYATLLVAPEDSERIGQSIEMEFPSLESVKEIYDKICSSLMVAYGEGEGRSFSFDAREFCIREKIFTATLQKAVKILQMNGYLNLTEELKLPSQLIFMVSRDDLYRVRINHPQLDSIIHIILRTYDGVFVDFQNIDEVYLSTISGYTLERVKELLAMLWRMRVIKYIPSNKSALMQLTQARVPIKDIYISPKSYKYRKELYVKRFEAMVGYANEDSKCRSQMMIEYFGVEHSDECGVCDNCLARRQNGRSKQERASEQKVLQQRVMELLALKPWHVSDLQQELRTNSEILSLVVEKLICDEVATHDSSGMLRKI